LSLSPGSGSGVTPPAFPPVCSPSPFGEGWGEASLLEREGERLLLTI